MEDFWKKQLDEVKENKLRFGLLVTALIVAIIFAVTDFFERDEEIILGAQQKISQVENVKTQSEPLTNSPDKSISSNAGNVKIVIGANAEEIYIGDPFKNPVSELKVEEPPKVEIPIKVEEKVLPPVVPPIIFEPASEILKPPAPEEKFVLAGVALGDYKVALIKKISDGKIETLFLQIGDTVQGKKISDITTEFLIFDNGERMYVEK